MDSSALTTRISTDGHVENNVARNAYASSSGAYYTQPVWTINDGRRGSPYDASIAQYAYWASSTTSTVYNCNYGNWWVRLNFAPAPGTVCPGGQCVHTISEIDLFSLQNNYTSGSDPTTSTLTSYYGNVDFHLSYCPENVTCGSTLGSGWVDPPGGYVVANNKAWTSISFPPVRATAIRASFDCAQSTRAYAVELEAWERQPDPDNCSSFATIPQDNQVPYVGDDNSTATIIADSDRVWSKWFADGAPQSVSVSGIDYFLSHNSPDSNGVPSKGMSTWWAYADQAWALVQMYDLLASIDFPRALVYLERLRAMSDAFLRNRDDKRTGFPTANQSTPPPYDPLHHQVMPAWGGIQYELDGQWSATVDMAGLFAYPMAAFARRVAQHPEWFCLAYRQDAVRFTTAVLETYYAFRQDMHFVDGDPEGYYVHPTSYAGLQCNWGSSSEQSGCAQQRSFQGLAIPMNQSMSLLRAMAEVASAADSELYKSAAVSFPWTQQLMIANVTNEAPRMVARFIRFFQDFDHQQTLSDGTTWYWWPYMSHHNTSPEDLTHGNFTVKGLVSVWENQGVLDGLLARNGAPERVGLTSAYLTGIANTFLRRIWYYDYQGTYLRNLLTGSIDGPNSAVYPPTFFHTDGTDGFLRPAPYTNGNPWCAGFAELAQFDRWAWVRCRDSVFNYQFSSYPGEWRALGPDSHAALLRYRAWWSP